MNVTYYMRKSKRRVVAKRLIDYCISALGLMNSRYNLVVMTFDVADGVAGGTFHDEDTIYVALAPKTSRQQFALAVVHEMIHVAQIAKGLLFRAQHGLIDITLWRGAFASDIPYDDRPWEKLAYARAPKLLEKAVTDLHSQFLAVAE